MPVCGKCSRKKTAESMKIKVKIKEKIKYFFPVLAIFSIGIFLLYKQFPGTVFRADELETYYLNERRSFYPNQKIARVFENKATLAFYKYKKNFFNGLDINLYFFATHPRERPEISEKERFNWLFMPFFLIGIFYQVRKKIFWIIIYFFITITVISLFTQINIYLYLLYPFFILTMFLGIYKLLRKSGKFI